MTRNAQLLLAALGLALVAVLAGQMLRGDDPRTEAEWIALGEEQAREYVETHDVRKLQIGTGDALLDGWLNTDIAYYPGVVYMDATERMPLDDDSFRYVFSEHVIEHLPFEKGVFMMQETYRVLEPGGKVRVVTPDLEVYLGLFSEERTAEQEAYIKGKLAWHGWKAGPRPEVSILNLQMHEFGHTFLYDRTTLEAVLRDIGFKDLQWMEVGQSDDEALRGVERRSSLSIANINAFEAMILQATK